jgi:ABC-type transport system substrate-binding protein
MYVEDLLSLLTIDSNGYLSNSTSAWSHPRHNDAKVDEMYARYGREMDAGKRKVIAKELQEYMVDKMYWNNISGSPFYQVAQPWMKGYQYNAEFEVHYHKVWLDR